MFFACIGAWTFFYFVNFCYLTDTWRRSKHEAETGISGCEAAIAFSFFSIGTFVSVQFYHLCHYYMILTYFLITLSHGLNAEKFYTNVE